MMDNFGLTLLIGWVGTVAAGYYIGRRITMDELSYQRRTAEQFFAEAKLWKHRYKDLRRQVIDGEAWKYAAEEKEEGP